MRSPTLIAAGLTLTLAPWIAGSGSGAGVRGVELGCLATAWLGGIERSLASPIPRRQFGRVAGAMLLPAMIALQLLLLGERFFVAPGSLAVAWLWAAVAASGLLLAHVSRTKPPPNFLVTAFAATALAVVALGFLQSANPRWIVASAGGAAYTISGGPKWLPHSISAEATFELAVRWACLALFAITLLQHVRHREHFLFLATAIVASGALFSIVGILDRLPGSRFLGPGHGSTQGGMGPFVARGNFAACANLALPLSLSLAILPGFFAPGRSAAPRRMLTGAVAALLLGGLALSGSRAGALAALGTSTFLVADAAIRRKPGAPGKWRAALVFAAGCGAVVLVGGPNFLKSRFDVLFADASAAERLVAMEAAWEGWCDSPCWGNGLGTFRFLFDFYRPVDQQAFYNHVHNDWLEALFDLGAVGAVPLIALVLGALAIAAWGRWSSPSPWRRSAASGILAACGGILLQALADYPLHLMPVQVAFVTLGASAVALCRPPGKDLPPTTPLPR
ncbi:MAG: O-antigen ligase family protein [Verrucomicrobiia bacterium]